MPLFPPSLHPSLPSWKMFIFLFLFPLQEREREGERERERERKRERERQRQTDRLYGPHKRNIVTRREEDFSL